MKQTQGRCYMTKKIAKKPVKVPRSKPRTAQQLAQDIADLLVVNNQCLGTLMRNQAAVLSAPSACLLVVEDSRSKRVQPIMGPSDGATLCFSFVLRDPNTVTVSILPLGSVPPFITEVSVGPYLVATGSLLSVDVVPNGPWKEGCQLTVKVKRMPADEARHQNEIGHVWTMAQAEKRMST